MKNPVVYFEIGCRNSQKTQSFYQSVFDWEIENLRINTQSEDGIQGHINSLGHEPHQYVTVYIQVEAIGPYLEKVEAQGGKKMVGPVQLPQGEYFAWIQDPDQNIIGLISSKP